MSATKGKAEPALRRLRQRREFLTVAEKGGKVVASTLVLQGYHPHEASDAIGVGFTVTRKTGNAVVRNRIRRRLRAAVAEILPEKGGAGWQYVVIGRKSAFDSSYPIILRDLKYAVGKLLKQGHEA